MDRVSNEKTARPRRSNNGQSTEEYDRFERTMRGLLKVPKKAIKEQAKKNGR